MLEKVSSGVVNFFAGRAIDNLVIIDSTAVIEGRFQQLIAEGGVPIVYGNHQGHGDGLALANVSGHLRDLTLQDGQYLLRGLAVILAKSMVSGHQSKELTGIYDLVIGACRQRGVVPVSVTREKDREKYGMSREKVAAEVIPLIRSLRKGYGMAFFPEGSVQGGRHPKGSGVEEIFGMQEPDNNNLIDFFKLMSRYGKPFFMPIGLHGSYRIMQSEEGDKPRLTSRGRRSLIAAALGIPIGVLRIKANLLMPFTEGEIAEEIGSEWMEDGTVFNRYAMMKLLPGIPDVAHGVFRD
ncbi:hypothetical protein A3B42_00345 [Candidatus Daviesbacteria bacterium RIFCSPLOWO2_01_FULL_38_10]|uniref:Phospholipid/glycerol acyltransferase domain-containing protein n=1 Tax=Candidatus Daviesbacteria bacterium GW2011_GWF2_38_6 TaxID=1618432 RepID=A0A0G0KLL3_9BACT|nr:MAG: hypothetical protein US99_C0074G0002 [Candidatus Daviesbacteria bacterium GW2011_GWF2_38_6]OGE26293.1 MAG: hypothetical protein A3D02_02905 [Candidatus Daviesbacteria bacterium RIFCSPHIGHO2_02_FULL_39_41]OGE29849.1 MAG: hypothetical protein A2772_02420 [Candidatus Daviesbacteria bacterium RIFCSPHIGHO2_01_FULL_38_8b]OGE37715.1 MAG: hypothetical protein A3B42_00345 [Candidatus Daviesbacteria bacterium RIFCSPLOWO2_01_FULL_38_10]OGE44694.1 MAG: hypothetical protein A3E67_04320 [Candidatus D